MTGLHITRIFTKFHFRSRPWLGVGVLLAVLSASPVIAQDAYQIGPMPSIAYKNRLSDNLIFKFDFESRHSFSHGVFGEGSPKNEYEFKRADFSPMLFRTLANGNSLNGGYLFRVKTGGETIHRIIQQYELKRTYSSFKMGHRFAAEQMYGPESKPEYRFRYRISFHWPLSGNTETGTTSIKAKNEYLYGFQGGDTEFEIRLGSTVAFQFSGGSEFAVGPEYRVSPVNESKKNHQFLLVITYQFGE